MKFYFIQDSSYQESVSFGIIVYSSVKKAGDGLREEGNIYGILWARKITLWADLWEKGTVSSSRMYFSPTCSLRHSSVGHS